MNVVILAAGEYPRKAYPRYLLSSADALVCCDGAVRAALRHGLRVDAVVGDMDSAPGSLTGPPSPGSPTGTTVPSSLSDSPSGFSGEIVREDEQETNDLSKAMRFVLAKWPSADAITILGATGKREAHTLGNLALLMEYEKEYGFWGRGVNVQMVSDFSTIFVVGDSCSLDVGEGRDVSFATCDQGLSVHSEGLQWPLDGVVFDNWWKATLNRATADRISLKFNHPAPLLVILD